MDPVDRRLNFQFSRIRKAINIEIVKMKQLAWFIFNIAQLIRK